MTGLVETSTADDQSQRDEAPHGAGHTPDPVFAHSGGSGLFAAIDGWRGVGWLFCGAAGGLAIAWFILLAPGDMGSKSDWFFGAVVLGAVLALMWQTVNVQRQANRRADERMARELAQSRKLHEAELESQRKAHRAELDAHRTQASLERTHLHNQLQKQAVIEVSRALSSHTQMLATLWNRGAGILNNVDRDEREQAMLPIFEQIGQVVNAFSVELANAHQIVDDSRLNRALEGVNDAVLMGIQVAQNVCDDIVDGLATEPNPIPRVQRLMYEKAAEARRLAWDLLRTGLDGSGS